MNALSWGQILCRTRAGLTTDIKTRVINFVAACTFLLLIHVCDSASIGKCNLVSSAEFGFRWQRARGPLSTAVGESEHCSRRGSKKPRRRPLLAVWGSSVSSLLGCSAAILFLFSLSVQVMALPHTQTASSLPKHSLRPSCFLCPRTHTLHYITLRYITLQHLLQAPFI